MSLILIASTRFGEHQTPPGHPESPARAAVLDVVAAEWRRSGGAVQLPKPATPAQLARVHSEAYLAKIEALSGRSTSIDADTFTSPETVEIARLSAGAAVDAVDCVIDGSHQRAMALVRPPGHHAERDRAMGFCIYNNIAVAAAHARARGLQRVAIIDYDVHHGNGTQHIFETDPAVLYVSAHQYPYYPGTGGADEIGVGNGAGYTVNIPLEAGATDADYRVAFEAIVLPVLTQFKPELVLVSAGFDAHARDPLGGMRLTTPAFGAMTASLRTAADAACGGRMVVVTEGGYDLDALGDSLLTVTTVLGATGAAAASWPEPTASSSRGGAAVDQAKRALAGFWSWSG